MSISTRYTNDSDELLGATHCGRQRIRVSRGQPGGATRAFVSRNRTNQDLQTLRSRDVRTALKEIKQTPGAQRTLLLTDCHGERAARGAAHADKLAGRCALDGISGSGKESLLTSSSFWSEDLRQVSELFSEGSWEPISMGEADVGSRRIATVDGQNHEVFMIRARHFAEFMTGQDHGNFPELVAYGMDQFCTAHDIDNVIFGFCHSGESQLYEYFRQYLRLGNGD